MKSAFRDPRILVIVVTETERRGETTIAVHEECAGMEYPAVDSWVRQPSVRLPEVVARITDVWQTAGITAVAAYLTGPSGPAGAVVPRATPDSGRRRLS